MNTGRLLLRVLDTLFGILSWIAAKAVVLPGRRIDQVVEDLDAEHLNHQRALDAKSQALGDWTRAARIRSRLEGIVE